MHGITLSKIPGARYESRTFKSYEARKGGEVVGTIAQDYSGRWEVVISNFTLVSRHTNIKAAVRVARQVL